MPKISIIIFILELYTQIGIIGNSITLPEIKGILDTVNIIDLNQFYPNILLSSYVQPGAKTENTFYFLKNLLLKLQNFK